MTQYEDVLDQNRLRIEGEMAHGADERIINSQARTDQIHLFYREELKHPFIYLGEIQLIKHVQHFDRPSRFEFAVNQVPISEQPTVLINPI